MADDNAPQSEPRTSLHGQWSGRWAYILAATGSAVGLGNIWKFPYITGEHGGGAFVLVYLICIAIIGIPVMMGEVLIGRRAKRSPVNALTYLSDEAGASRVWVLIGWLGMLAGFLILSFYAVIAGWAFAYVFRSGAGVFTGGSADHVGEIFSAFTGNPLQLIIWTTIILFITMFIVARGVEHGLELAVRYMMPGMLVLLLILVGYAWNTDGFVDGLKFLFQPDFGKLTANGALVALGHAFFTLSLASGVMMTYGAYLPEDTSIAKTTFTIAAADTVIALLAGLAIFPIVFANDLEPGAGPGLIFVTLPIAFGQMPYGAFFGTLFFIMLSFAALTSAISLLEPTVAWLVERVGLTRQRAAVFTGITLWILGLGTVFSFNLLAHLTLFEKTFFDILDYTTANIMLPLGGLLIALFTAWIMSDRNTRHELELGESHSFTAWQFLMRYVTPIAIIVFFLHASGILGFILGTES